MSCSMKKYEFEQGMRLNFTVGGWFIGGWRNVTGVQMSFDPPLTSYEMAMATLADMEEGARFRSYYLPASSAHVDLLLTHP